MTKHQKYGSHVHSEHTQKTLNENKWSFLWLGLGSIAKPEGAH